MRRNVAVSSANWEMRVLAESRLIYQYKGIRWRDDKRLAYNTEDLKFDTSCIQCRFYAIHLFYSLVRHSESVLNVRWA